MTEPEYIYVKGEGWCIKTYKSAVYPDQLGQMCRLTIRAPLEGEKYIAFNKRQSWLIDKFYTDGQLDLQKVYYNHFKGCKWEWFRSYEAGVYKNHDFVVVELVDGT